MSARRKATAEAPEVAVDVEDTAHWFGTEARARLADRVSKAHHDVVAFVENNPLPAVGAAALLGFLVARVFRR